MHHQMIYLAGARGAVLLGLIRVLDPQLVQDANLRITMEFPVQIVRHLPFRRGAGALARVHQPRRLLVALDDHRAF